MATDTVIEDVVRDPIGENRVKEEKKDWDLAEKYWEKLRDDERNVEVKNLIERLIKAKVRPSQEVLDYEAKRREYVKPGYGQLTEAEIKEQVRKEKLEKQREEDEIRRAALNKEYPDLVGVDFDTKLWATRLERFIESIGKKTRIEHDRPAPGKVLRKQKPKLWAEEDWSELKSITGETWSKTNIRKVGNALKEHVHLDEILGPYMKAPRLNDHQIHTLVEMLVASRRSPTELAVQIGKFQDMIKNLTLRVKADNARRRGEDVPDLDSTDTDPAKVKDRDEWKTKLNQRNMSEAERKELLTRYFQSLGIDRSDYIEKFVFPNEFTEELSREYQYTTRPPNIENLAWQFSYNDVEKFGINGTFPVLEMRIEADEKTGFIKEGKYYVNTGNLNRWPRDRMSWIIGEEPENPNHDYFNIVYLYKDLRPFTLKDMFESEQTVFKSEDGETTYLNLAYHMRVEAGATTFLRALELKYKNTMANDEKLVESIITLFYENPLSRNILDKNIMYYLVNMPLDYDGFDKSDVKLGAAWLDMALAYYNIADFDKLQQILGPDSAFFTERGMVAGIMEIIKRQQKYNFGNKFQQFLGPEGYALFSKAFDENGKLRDKKSFIEFINFYNMFGSMLNKDQVNAVREAMKLAIAEKYHITREDGVMDKGSLDLTELQAFCFSRVSGASARNELRGTAYDAANKWVHTDLHRAQQVKLSGAWGYEGTIPQFKGILVPYLEGTQTEAYTDVKDIDGNVIGRRHKTQLEVLEELQELRSRQVRKLDQLQEEARRATGEDKEKKTKLVAELSRQANNEYRLRSDDLEMVETTMRYYAQEHVANAHKIFQKLIKSSEFDFEKFTEHGFFGIRFKRAEFQEGVIENFFKPLRVMYTKYKQINFNQQVRDWVEDGPNGERKFKDVTLAEAMFGYQLLNRSQFWMRDKHGKPVYDPETGRHMIDANKVNTDWGKVLLWKSWALMEIGNRLAAHRDIHSTDPLYNFTYYLNVIEALKSIPGEFLGDDSDIRSVKKSKPFFDKNDIKWFRSISGLSNRNLYGRALLETFFMPKSNKGTGWDEAIQHFFHAIRPR